MSEQTNEQNTSQKEKKQIGLAAAVGFVLVSIIIGGLIGYAVGSYTTQNSKLVTMDAKLDKLVGFFNQIQQGGTQQPTKVDIDVAGAPFMGPSDSPNVVVVFSDYQCPYCGAFEGTNTALIEQFKTRDNTYEPSMPYLKGLAEDGKIKLVFMNFPLNFHQNAFDAALAAACAKEQNRFWQMHEKLFSNQDSLTKENFIKWAGEIDMADEVKFKQCLEQRTYEEKIKKEISDGQKYGVSGTPTTFVNGMPVVGAVPSSEFKLLLE